MNEPKVFVVSMHKTMTRSVDILLSMLGYSTLHFPKFYKGVNFLESVRGVESDPEVVIDIMLPVLESRQAFSDVPIPGLYRQLAERWPTSRFVLVTRDPFLWARSVKRHLRGRPLSPFNRIQYQLYLESSVKRISDLKESELAVIHQRHEEEVRLFFERERGEPERLCVVDARDGGVGERICGFLGQEPRSLPVFTGRFSEDDFSSVYQWVEKRPDKADAHYYMAKILLKLGRKRDAVQHLYRAVDNEPDQPKPYALLAEHLWQQGHIKEGTDAACKAVSNGLRKPRLIRRSIRGRLREGALLSASGLWALGVKEHLRRRVRH